MARNGHQGHPRVHSPDCREKHVCMCVCVYVYVYVCVCLCVRRVYAQFIAHAEWIIAERSEANNRAVCDLGWRMYIYIYIYIYIFASVAPGPGGAPVNSAR